MPISTSTYPPLVRVRWNCSGYRSRHAGSPIADEMTQETVENPGRCAPHGLVREIEEVDLDVGHRRVPALGAMHAGGEQLGERDVQDPHDFARVRTHLRPHGQNADEWRDDEPGRPGSDPVELRHDLDGCRGEPDLFVRLPQRG